MGIWALPPDEMKQRRWIRENVIITFLDGCLETYCDREQNRGRLLPALHRCSQRSSLFLTGSVTFSKVVNAKHCSRDAAGGLGLLGRGYLTAGHHSMCCLKTRV